MNEQQLRDRLKQSEDPFVERKESCNDDRVARTIVAFANSVLEGNEAAVLFLGVADDGKIVGLPKAANTQIDVQRIAGERVYPSIEVQMSVVEIVDQGKRKEVLAVVVPASKRKPHFTGSAWVRRGSQTVRANEEQFNELIASRNDKVRVLQKYIGKTVVLSLVSDLNKLKLEYWNARLLSATATTIDVDTGEYYSYPFATERVEVFDRTPTLIGIRAPSPVQEKEHIRLMVRYWGNAHPTCDGGIPNDQTKYIYEQLLSNVRLTIDVVRWEFAVEPAQSLRVLKSTLEHALSIMDKSS